MDARELAEVLAAHHHTLAYEGHDEFYRETQRQNAERAAQQQGRDPQSGEDSATRGPAVTGKHGTVAQSPARPTAGARGTP